ncbi:MAG: HAMP domain-containing protein [Bdellovibrionales bacterium]|nr:HAMP domain-containing protein [Bdellovibrionales bacterium]
MVPERPEGKSDLRERRKRQRERAIILGLALVFLLLTSVEFRLSKISATLPFVNSIFFFGLINFNIVILVALIWLIFKNVGKIFFERRRQVLGARLKTKLVTAFIGFSTIPTLLLFFISALYINTSFDKWFSLKIQNTLQSSLEITSLYYKNAETTSAHFAGLIAKQVRSTALSRKLTREETLLKQVEPMRATYNLNAVEIYFDPLDEPMVVMDPESRINNPNAYVRLSLDRLKQAFQGSHFSFIQNIGHADLVRSVAPIIDYTSGQIKAIVLVDTIIPVSLTSRAGQIAHTAEDYKDINPLKYPIKTTYLVILIVITLLIIFAETWLGLYLAREMTVPVERLVKAAQEVGRGKLDVQIEKTGTDEIAVLVETFNKMTSDLRSGQSTLRQRTQQLEAILSNIATGVILVDEHGTILTINHAAITLLELESGDYHGKPMQSVFAGEQYQVLLGALNAGLQDLSRLERERAWASKIKGEVHNLTAITTPLKERGNIWGAVAVLDDLTYLVKGQREMAWREVAKRIAHEIKNPLTPIKLSAQRLQRRLKELSGRDGQLVQELTSTIIQHTDELKEMVNEFGNFARFPEVNPYPNQLNDIIHETMQLYVSAHPELHFITRLEPKLPVFNIDKDQMKRVIINLLDNAIAAIKSRETTGPGRVEIETHYNEKLDVAALTIHDNGPGMTEQVQDRAFEPYFSTKQEGTGLGLAIVKRIVNDHGGYIRLSSTLGEGTTFMIELPTKTIKLVS